MIVTKVIYNFKIIRAYHLCVKRSPLLLNTWTLQQLVLHLTPWSRKRFQHKYAKMETVSCKFAKEQSKIGKRKAIQTIVKYYNNIQINEGYQKYLSICVTGFQSIANCLILLWVNNIIDSQLSLVIVSEQACCVRK